jgi:hypothetical protein
MPHLAFYEAGSRKIVKIGAEFDKETRNTGRWLAI